MLKMICLTAAIIGFVAGAFAGPVKVGAIRWDAWVGAPNTVGATVEKTLGPSQYHYRVPFYGMETGTNSIQARATTQAVMDQEIVYAKTAGLNYWAFLWYPPASGLDIARKLYLSSTHVHDINFCLIIEVNNFPTNITPAQIVSFMSMTNYQKVLGNRPILYFLGYAGIKKSDVDSIRAGAERAGLGKPYIVMMRTDSNLGILGPLGLDAFSMYATSWVGGGAPYSLLASTDIGQWDWIKSQGYKIVPNVTAGWDKRPRADNPVSWDHDPGNYNTQWVIMPTPTELANHVQDAITWVRKNPAAADAGTALIYSWNEFDEGGWICPTLTNYDGTARLDAIKRVLVR